MVRIKIVANYKNDNNMNKEEIIDKFLKEKLPFAQHEDNGLLKTQMYSLLEYAEQEHLALFSVSNKEFAVCKCQNGNAECYQENGNDYCTECNRCLGQNDC